MNLAWAGWLGGYGIASPHDPQGVSAHWRSLGCWRSSAAGVDGTTWVDDPGGAGGAGCPRSRLFADREMQCQHPHTNHGIPAVHHQPSGGQAGTLREDQHQRRNVLSRAVAATSGPATGAPAQDSSGAQDWVTARDGSGHRRRPWRRTIRAVPLQVLVAWRPGVERHPLPDWPAPSPSAIEFHGWQWSALDSHRTARRERRAGLQGGAYLECRYRLWQKVGFEALAGALARHP